MFRNRLNRVAAAALAAVLAVACAPTDDARSDLLAPARAPVRASVAATESAVELVPSLQPYAKPVAVTRDIGKSGGEILVPLPGGKTTGFRVWVPAGAVPATTRFTVTALAGPHVMVDLVATRKINGVVVDVGAQGFAVPVKLRVARSLAAPPPTGRRLVVAWVRTTALEPAVSATTAEGDTEGDLPHFSRWALAQR